MAARKPKKPVRKSVSFRVGRVRVFQRGRVWYLCYREHGRRRQPRVGPDHDLARQTAAEINAQLEVGVPSALGFEPASITDVRQRWLDQHEHVRRSSLATIRRYRAATNHLLRFVADVRPVRRISDFRPIHAEEFVRHLRRLKTAPNGHKNAAKRQLRDNGVKFILETCCTMFNYARRQRHLSPYAENPFVTIEVGRIPVEDAKPIVVFDRDLERRFFEACDDWQLPVFLTLLFTGLRPGELVHLLLPDDLDLESGWLHIRNKPKLGWQVKTRNERDVPLAPDLVKVLRRLIGERQTGPVFRQRQYSADRVPILNGLAPAAIASEIDRRMLNRQTQGSPDLLVRESRQSAAKAAWLAMGALRPDWIRIEFMRLTSALGISEITAPKTLRHTFATILQDANVDPLIRNELMGHSPAGSVAGAAGLGMTSIYTHTRPETMKQQLEFALRDRPAAEIAARRLAMKFGV